MTDLSWNKKDSANWSTKQWKPSEEQKAKRMSETDGASEIRETVCERRGTFSKK